MKTLVLITIIIGISSAQKSETCYRQSYGRGVGNVPDTCGPNEEKDGQLCYPKCRDGFKGVGPVCWESCRAGFKDRGIACSSDFQIYGKGCCCTIFTKKCCNNCPADFKDDGCTCRKSQSIYAKGSYGRGAGNLLSCRESEKDAGLCYPKCQDGFNGVGPVCWKKCEYSELNKECGVLCAASEGACTVKTVELSTSVFDILVLATVKDPKVIEDIISKYNLPLCP